MRDEMRPSASTAAIAAEEWGPGYRVWNALCIWLGQRGPEGTTSLVRMASHLLILAVALAVLLMSRLQLPSWEIAEVSTVETKLEDGVAAVIAGEAASRSAEALVRSAVPKTLIPDRPREDIMLHTVQPGDTLYAIAENYRISAETLVWANNMDENPDLLRLDQELVVLPVNGVLHTMAQGDTLESIAKKYKANLADVLGLEWNRLDPKNPVTTIGQKVLVPGGTKPQPLRPLPLLASSAAPSGAPRGGGRFIWPASGGVTQRFFAYHRAVDLGAPYGAPVKASDAGYVAVAGWSNVGYGYHVIVDHGNGYQTLYAHLSKILVQAGQAVDRGGILGAVGSSGYSTGAHLHFELRLNGVTQNPFNYLP